MKILFITGLICALAGLFVIFAAGQIYGRLAEKKNRLSRIEERLWRMEK